MMKLNTEAHCEGRGKKNGAREKKKKTITKVLQLNIVTLSLNH